MKLLMQNLMRYGAQLCHLLTSASSHNVTWLKMKQFKGNQIRRKIRRKMEFIAHIHQDEVRKVLFRIIMDFNLIDCALVHFCCRPPDGLPCRSSISGILCRCWAIIHTLAWGTSSQIESCSLSLFQFSSALTISRHYPFGLNDFVLSPGGLTMVWQRMLSCHGGNKGG